MKRLELHTYIHPLRHWYLAPVLAGLLASFMLWAIPSLSWAVAFNTGDIFAGVFDLGTPNGTVQHYDSAGNLLETLNTGLPGSSGVTTGMAFDANGNLYVTNFLDATITRFDANGNILPPNPFVTNDPGSFNESIAFDTAGNFYVGQALGTKEILKYDSNGTFLNRFTVATETRGSDWIDLAADQKTIFYTSEGRTIFRFDTATNTQLPNFATLPGTGTAFALRLLNDGGLLVADGIDIKRLDSTGTVIQTYDAPGEDQWFALNLDPDGTSFWSGNSETANFYKFDIASGNILAVHNTGTGPNTLFGLAIFNEPTQAVPLPPPGGGNSGNTPVIPEPGTVFLLGTGLLGLGVCRWKRLF
ncbi:MAG: PEP-CTERM sorting domain-containing protein [Nitrospirae bacterium]|nr:MAG: PEP-CTERM sorting domain-containing protein [Nitrospirota bacterium]